jgi:glutamate 5-kinase
MSRIDEGAYRAITSKESGGRLLPAGVVRVEGVFASHQGIRLVVRRRRTDTKNQNTSSRSNAAEGASPTSPDAPSSLVSPSLKHLNPTAGGSTSQPAPASPSSSPEANAQPGTPFIQPAASMSSSVASLEPLSRSVPPSPAMKAITERISATTIGSSLGQELRVVQETQVLDAAKEAQVVLDADDEWEEVEIGKGLSHYNSVEMERIKGMKRYVPLLVTWG